MHRNYFNKPLTEHDLQSRMLVNIQLSTVLTMTDIARRPLQTYYKKLYIKPTFEKSAWFMQKYDMTILAYE